MPRVTKQFTFFFGFEIRELGAYWSERSCHPSPKNISINIRT